jgi:hypothetical protein
VLRFALLLAFVVGCQPKQPLQASFFTAPKPASAPASCRETLSCYSQCQPMTEECMLVCDQKGHPKQVELARAVTYCSAQHGCTDQACTDELCATEIHTCTSPAVAPAPSPMNPQPYPGQVGYTPPR